MTVTNKQRLIAALMTAVLAGPVLIGSTTALADQSGTNPAEAADITNWIANTPQQISTNMAMQHINTNNLNGTRYVIQWGDTLSGISLATGISIAKLCYDNNIQNANLIYAGDVLILNRDGSVPTDYVVPAGSPYAVARTRFTINNGPTNVTVTVKPQTVIKNETNNSSDQSKSLYQVPASGKEAPVAQSGSQSANGTTAAGKATDSSTTSTKEAVTTASVVAGLEDAKGADSKLTFNEYPQDNVPDTAKKVDVNGKALMKVAKKGDYQKLLDKIKDALDDAADQKGTVYIEKDGNKLNVYLDQGADSSSDSASDQSSSDQSSDSQSDQQSSQSTSPSSSDQSTESDD